MRDLGEQSVRRVGSADATVAVPALSEVETLVGLLIGVDLTDVSDAAPSATSTTSSPSIKADRRAPTTPKASANPATTPGRHEAGRRDHDPVPTGQSRRPPPPAIASPRADGGSP